MHFSIALVILLQLVLNRGCHGVNGQFFLMTDYESKRIFRYDPATDSVEFLNLSHPVNRATLSYDPFSEHVFWSTGVQHLSDQNSIKTALLSGISERMINIGLTNGIAVLAFDSSEGRLYYSEAGSNLIASVAFNGSNHRNVITDGIKDPKSLVVVPSLGKLFWTDWGTGAPFIARADMRGGRNLEVLISITDLHSPNGLAVDSTTDEMFWCDGELGRIEKASLDGKSRELLYAHEDHYFGLTIDDEYVYVTGRTIRGMQRTSRKVQKRPPSIEREELPNVGRELTSTTPYFILYVPPQAARTSATSTPVTKSSASVKTISEHLTTTSEPSKISEPIIMTTESVTSSKLMTATEYLKTAASLHSYKSTFLGVQWSSELVVIILTLMFISSFVTVLIMKCISRYQCQSNKLRQSPSGLQYFANDGYVESERESRENNQENFNCENSNDNHCQDTLRYAKPKVFTRKLPHTPDLQTQMTVQPTASNSVSQDLLLSSTTKETPTVDTKDNEYTKLENHMANSPYSQYSKLVQSIADEESLYVQLS